MRLLWVSRHFLEPLNCSNPQIHRKPIAIGPLGALNIFVPMGLTYIVAIMDYLEHNVLNSDVEEELDEEMDDDSEEDEEEEDTF